MIIDFNVPRWDRSFKEGKKNMEMKGYEANVFIKELMECAPELQFLSGIVSLIEKTKDSGKLRAYKDSWQICRDSMYWSPVEIWDLLKDPEIQSIEFRARTGEGISIARRVGGDYSGAWYLHVRW